ncbi:MAG: GNAT family N-acetyltransferase [Pirellulaceae bacterium]|nr:GNAT family N-acetyltransferase [Pirellulaceae bacterium]
MSGPVQSALSIAPAQPAQVAEVLALAARGWPLDERAGQLRVVADLLKSAAGDHVHLLGAWRGKSLVGAIVAQTLAGRAAVVWPPTILANESAATGGELFAALHQRLVAAGAVLVQALLPSVIEEGAQALMLNGYLHAGDLRHLWADAAVFPRESPDLPFALEAWSPANNGRLVQVVEATYRGSLDCPVLDGLREVGDVLAGYQAVGEFRAENWLIVREGGADVGCLLLARHSAQNQLEIVYLGLAPQVRGCGWGYLLTRHAQWIAQKAGHERLVLAVDAANRPAIAAYERAGLVAWGARSVFVRSLTK